MAKLVFLFKKGKFCHNFQQKSTLSDASDRRARQSRGASAPGGGHGRWVPAGEAGTDDNGLEAKDIEHAAMVLERQDAVAIGRGGKLADNLHAHLRGDIGIDGDVVVAAAEVNPCRRRTWNMDQFNEEVVSFSAAEKIAILENRHQLLTEFSKSVVIINKARVKLMP